MPTKLKAPRSRPAPAASSPSRSSSAQPVSGAIEPLRDFELLDDRFKGSGLVRAHRTRAADRPQSKAAIDSTILADLARCQAIPPGLQNASNSVSYIAVPAWDRFNWLWHGFSTRVGGLTRTYSEEKATGELNLGYTADDDRDTVAANRRLLAEAITGDPAVPLIGLRQIHSNIAVVKAGADAAGQPEKADGLMTGQPGLLLAVQTADCIPVLVADRKRHAVAAFHAGWRGTVRRIVEAGIGRMRLEFGSRPEDLIAAIGPGIGQCCYSVGEEVVAEFESQFGYARELFITVDDADPVLAKYPMMFMNQRAPGHGPRASKIHLNLIEANRRQLLDVGVKAAATRVVGGCTACHPHLYFSHRASGGRTGRMMSVIGIRPRS